MKMGTVDVERYTGSCLITTAVRPKSKHRSVNASAVNSSSPSGSVTSEQQMPGDAVPVVVVPPGSPGLPATAVLPGNDPRNWAGAPLLSMAASIRKTGNSKHHQQQPLGGKHQQNWGHHHQQHHHHGPVYLPAGFHASHLQGAPLIRVPRQPYQGHKKQQASRRPYVSGPVTSVPALTPPPPPLVSPHQMQPAKAPTVVVSEVADHLDSASSLASSDSCSVTSDEGLASGGSESSLPRIIKPRRRKKTHHHNGNGGSSSKAPLYHEPLMSDLDALLSNGGDPLADLFRSCVDVRDSAAAESSTAPAPLSWPAQEDIWGSSSWHSLSPTWSSSGSSSASYWPDHRVIRRPTASAGSTLASSTEMASASPFAGLQVSSQLIASPFNGHRDIEIRFFSQTSPSSSSPSDPQPE